MATGALQSHERSNLANSLREFHTAAARSLLELVDQSPVLLGFLRHFACAFCAQALDRVSEVRSQIEAKGVGRSQRRWLPRNSFRGPGAWTCRSDRSNPGACHPGQAA